MARPSTVSRVSVPTKPLPGAKDEHEPHAVRQRRRGRAARRACGGRGRIGARLRVAPGVAAKEVAPASSKRRRARCSCAASAPCSCWLRSQLSCKSRCCVVALGADPAQPAPVAQRPDDDLQAVRRAPRELQRSAVEAQVGHDGRSLDRCQILLPLRERGVQPQRRLHPLLADVARAHHAVHALPCHHRQQAHDEQRDEHFDKGETARAARGRRETRAGPLRAPGRGREQ